LSQAVGGYPGYLAPILKTMFGGLRPPYDGGRG